MRREPNPGQADAIGHDGGALFVSAGAGSGKTFVLASRAARLMEAAGGGPAALDRVLVITFTEKAAGEILERVRRELAELGDDEAARAAGAAWVSTIHGFCLRVLRRHALEAGLDPRFRVADEEEAWALRRESFETAAREQLDDPDVERLFEDIGLHRVAPAAIASLESVRGMGLRPEDVILPDEPLVAADAAAFARLLDGYARRYDSAKRERSVVDYEDMQLLTARLFEEQPAIAEQYATHFEEVMIDEFQDTNALQMRAVVQLAEGTLCTVGDECQAIYGFRNADITVFRRHHEEAETGGAHTSALTVNYRSHPEILSFANALFSRPRLFGERFLKLEAGRDGDWKVPWPGDSPRVELIVSDKEGTGLWREAEAEALAERLRELVDAGASPGDVVVLLRYGGCGQIYADALRRRGLPVSVATGQPFFGRLEVADLRALLRAIANPLDDEAVLRVLAGRTAGLSDTALLALRTAAGKGPLWRVLGDPGSAGLEGLDRAQASRVREVLAGAARSAGGSTFSQALADAIEGLDYDLALLAGPDGRVAYSTVLKMLRMARRYERDGTGGILGFLDGLSQREALGVREGCADPVAQDGNAVRIMTVHSAKGLEFPIVAVADMGHGARADREAAAVSRDEEGRPALRIKALDDKGKLVTTPEYDRLASLVAKRDAEEEQRLLYVACTRAEEVLILAGSTRLDKEPGGATAIDLVLRELPEHPASGAVEIDGARVRVTVAPPLEAVPEAECPPMPERPSEAPDRESDPKGPVDADSAPRTVSYTALRTHSLCPRRYELERTLGLRTYVASGEADPRRLGDALHAVLQVSRPPGPADLGRIDAAARLQGLDTAARDRLVASASSFLESELAARLHSDEDVRKEAPFAVPVAGSLLVGKMDAIGRSAAGWLVVDYKTGQGKPESDGAYRMQAECYALAALASGAGSVEVVFAELETGEERAFSFEPGDEARIRDWIEEALLSMSGRDLPDCGRFDKAACPNCPSLPGMCSVRR